MSIQLIRNWVYKRLTLKLGIVILICLGALSILYIIGSSFSSSERGPLESFAVGEMSGFRTVSDAPDLPDIMLTLQDNQQIPLTDKKGKIILVNFWATWCAPCIVEMPSLNELEREFGSDLFEVLPVSLDASLVQAVNFYIDNKLDNLKVYHHGYHTCPVTQRGICEGSCKEQSKYKSLRN